MSTQRAMRALGRRVQTWECVIRRIGPGPGVLDSATLEVVPVASVVVYRGKASFGARRSGQRRDDGFADRREEVGMLRLDATDADVSAISVDDEIEWLEGPMCEVRWYVVGAMESSWGATKRFMIRRNKQEVSQS